MRNDFESNYLAHWGLKKGAQKEKHKYVARVELPDGKYRYFYTLAEYAAYLKDKGKELWEKVSPLMLSPVDRVVYTDHELMEIPSSGESALEQYTMIAAPEKPCKAVSKEWALEQKDMLNKYDGNYLVEIWRYDPNILEKNHTIDPLSLYLSLRTSDDERIKIELKNLISSVAWLED